LDDDQAVRYLVMALLERKGFKVVAVACVSEAA
jgi:CheY-like chemotaxis protein